MNNYSTLRPLVYRDCSVVLICYSSGGLEGVKSWAKEVRKSTNAPLVLVHTKNDEEAEKDMVAACEMCERIGAVNWETTSAKTGENVQTVFDLCIAAANTATTKYKIKRPNTLIFSQTNSSSGSQGETKNKGEHIYENPDKLVLPKSKRRYRENCFSFPNNIHGNIDLKRKENPSISGKNINQSSPLPPRPHSAHIAPSSLYRYNSNRVSMQAKLKAVPIPLSPNCDTRDKYSDTSSILSPTDSTASSIISSNISSIPPFRNSKYLLLPSPSTSSSSMSYQAFSPTSFHSALSSDRDSGFYSSTEHFHQTKYLRKVKSPNISEQFRGTALQDQIKEVEETCEEHPSGCSIFPTRQKIQISDKSPKFRTSKSPSSNRLGKKNIDKERCSLM